MNKSTSTAHLITNLIKSEVEWEEVAGVNSDKIASDKRRQKALIAIVSAAIRGDFEFDLDRMELFNETGRLSIRSL